jgi:hypothetical protein
MEEVDIWDMFLSPQQSVCFTVWMVPCVSVSLQLALVSLLPSPLLHFIFVAMTSILVSDLKGKNLFLVFVKKFCLGGCSCWASGSWHYGWRVILSWWLCTYSNAKCIFLLRCVEGVIHGVNSMEAESVVLRLWWHAVDLHRAVKQSKIHLVVKHDIMN